MKERPSGRRQLRERIEAGFLDGCNEESQNSRIADGGCDLQQADAAAVERILSGLVACLLGGLALWNMAISHLLHASPLPAELSATSLTFWSLMLAAGLYCLGRGIRQRRSSAKGSVSAIHASR